MAAMHWRLCASGTNHVSLVELHVASCGVQSGRGVGMRFEASFSVEVDEYGRIAHECVDYSLLPLRYERLTLELDEPMPRRQIGYAIVWNDDRVVHAAAVVSDRLRIDLDLAVPAGDHAFWFLCAGLDPGVTIKGRAVVEGRLDLAADAAADPG